MTFLNGKVDIADHEEGHSTVRTAEGAALEGSMVLDATGHVRKLVKFDQKFDPGYQGAYGIIVGEQQQLGPGLMYMSSATCLRVLLPNRSKDSHSSHLLRL